MLVITQLLLLLAYSLWARMKPYRVAVAMG